MRRQTNSYGGVEKMVESLVNCIKISVAIGTHTNNRVGDTIFEQAKI